MKEVEHYLNYRHSLSTLFVRIWINSELSILHNIVHALLRTAVIWLCHWLGGCVTGASAESAT